MYIALQGIIVSLFIPWSFNPHSNIITQLFDHMGISILVFLLTASLFTYVNYKKIAHTKWDICLAFLFSLFTIIGYLFSTSTLLTKNMNLIAKIVLKILAFTLLYLKLLAVFNYGILQLHKLDARLNTKEHRFLGKKSFRNTTITLLILWLPIIILSYPGNLVGDTLMQIWEAEGMRNYWAHNPLFHTMILKFFLTLGKWLFDSISVGFFLCSIAQCIGMAMVLGYSMQRLYERNIGIIARYIIFAVYVLTPTYSNMATSPGKDMVYMALFLLYILFIEKIIYYYEHKDTITDKGQKLTFCFWLCFALVSIVLCLVRKNGIYILIPTGIILFISLMKKTNSKEKLLIFVMCCVIPFIGFKLTQNFLEAVTCAEPGSIREMLSIPFQQTARYLHVYGDEITDFERESINTILVDTGLVGRIYTPDISDPVKGLYNLDATTTDLINYFKAWFIGLIKHPLVYVEAFFQHVYGWFYPGVVNVIRYHATDEIITAPAFFVAAREYIKVFYEKLGYIPPFSLLENMGAYVWTLFWLLFKKGPKSKWLLFPLFMSLLICMASPAFYQHPRYGYPILISIPFISAILINSQNNEDACTTKQ